jgi:membrane fusion protein, heavy metal efflux system
VSSQLSPPLEAASDRRPGRRWWIVLAVVVVVVAAIAFYVRSKGSHVERAVVVRDVPRMEGNNIVFSNTFRARAGISFARTERTQFKPTVRVVGTVAFNPSYVAALGTRLRGTVRRTFKYEGDHVAAGEALAEVESAELGEAQAGIAQAEAALQAADAHARREQDLLDKGLTTARESEVASSELARNRAGLQAAQQRVHAFGGGAGFGLYVIRSPIAGHVVERHLSPGQSVEGTAVGYKVADLSHLWIELSVFERDLGAVHIDDDVDVSPLADLTVKIPGKVAHVGQVIDPVSRSTDVRIRVDNPKVHLRVGQSVEATITSGTAPREALLVPHAAVVYVDGKATVFVAENETRVRAVPVRLGASDGARHEVLEGLQAGELVASGGVFALKSELYR